MSKTINIEYPAGTKVVVMKNNEPVSDVIRVVHYTNSIELRDGKHIENESITYGTLGNKLASLNENQIGKTNKELSAKLFGGSSESESDNQ